MSTRPRSWVGVVVATVVVVAVLAGGLVVWRLVGPDRTYSAPPSRAEPRQADPAAAARVLAAWVQAVEDRDSQAATALAPASDQQAATLLGAIADNADALDVVDLTARYVDEAGVDVDGSWSADVDLSWRFQGFDAEPVHDEVRVTFHDEAGGASEDAGGVGITGFGGGPGRSPLWLSGPVQVRRGAGNLVLASTAADADLLAKRSSRAVTVVRRVLPSWRGGLVVEVPASEEQLDTMLAAQPDSYDAIAAVSASVDGTVTATSPVHVFINPTVYDALDPVGGQVVLSHEATHIATDAPVTAGLPSWLLEGFADYVALRDVHLPLSTTAGQILSQVRESGPPDHLPDGTDFNAQATHLGASYEAAWLVCRVLADVGGQDALVRFYQQASAGEPVAGQLRRQFGLTEAQLLTRWQQRLTQLAAATKTAS